MWYVLGMGGGRLRPGGEEKKPRTSLGDGKTMIPGVESLPVMSNAINRRASDIEQAASSVLQFKQKRNCHSGILERQHYAMASIQACYCNPNPSAVKASWKLDSTPGLTRQLSQSFPFRG